MTDLEKLDDLLRGCYYKPVMIGDVPPSLQDSTQFSSVILSFNIKGDLLNARLKYE